MLFSNGARRIKTANIGWDVNGEPFEYPNEGKINYGILTYEY